MTIRIRDLPAQVVLESLKKEIDKNKQHDKTGTATVILASIYNALSDAYIHVVNEIKNRAK